MTALIKVGTTVRTAFLQGNVCEVINGIRKGWRPTEYYRVLVIRPVWAAATSHIVRLDEVLESGMTIKVLEASQEKVSTG